MILLCHGLVYYYYMLQFLSICLRNLCFWVLSLSVCLSVYVTMYAI